MGSTLLASEPFDSRRDSLRLLPTEVSLNEGVATPEGQKGGLGWSSPSGASGFPSRSWMVGVIS